MSLSAETRTPLGVLLFVLSAGSFATGASAYTEKTLYEFCSVGACTDGREPMGELAMDQSGNLYGTTYGGGIGYSSLHPGAGVVFEFAPGTGQYSELYKFCSLGTACPDGGNPERVRLVVDTAGNLYGTTQGGGNDIGGGVIFELIRKQSGWQEKVLYTFCSRRKCHDGGDPLAGLTYAGEAAGQVYDGTSPLYGTTAGGGAYGGGTVFSLTPARFKKWRETVLYSFCSQTSCADGEEPDSALFVDSAGNLYGATKLGGQGNGEWGTVFELSPNGNGYIQSVLHNFCSQQNCTDGSNPLGGVVMDGAGNLFGTTQGGSQDGLIFELSPNSGQWQYSILANFDGSNGRTPEGELLLDASGNLFGTTNSGGSRNRGTAYEFNGSLQTLYNFCSQQRCLDGKYPSAGVIEDGEGDLFGTATNGGARHDSGTIFELSAGTKRVRD